MTTTWDKRLIRLEPPQPPQRLSDRALRRAVLAELAEAAKFYHHATVDLEMLADEADRAGATAHRGAQVAAILLDVQESLQR